MEVFSPLHVLRVKRLKHYINHIPNLLLYYPMWEKDGTTVRNYAPATLNTLNGTASGPTMDGEGKVGRAYSFDGVNDTISTEIDTVSTAFSVFFIFKSDFTSSADNARGIVNKREAANEWRIITNNSRVLTFNGWSDASTITKSVSTAALTAATWYAILATYDGTTSSLYVNGGTPETTTSGNAIQNTAATVLIGRESNDVDRYFTGMLHHFAFYNQALTAAHALRLAQIAGLA